MTGDNGQSEQGATEGRTPRRRPQRGGRDYVCDRFADLADWWHEATDVLSLPSAKVHHRAYQRIIELGPEATPLILQDLRERGGYWTFALERIEGHSPLPKDQPASPAALKQAWWEWGASKQLL